MGQRLRRQAGQHHARRPVVAAMKGAQSRARRPPEAEPVPRMAASGRMLHRHQARQGGKPMQGRVAAARPELGVDHRDLPGHRLGRRLVCQQIRGGHQVDQARQPLCQLRRRQAQVVVGGRLRGTRVVAPARRADPVGQGEPLAARVKQAVLEQMRQAAVPRRFIQPAGGHAQRQPRLARRRHLGQAHLEAVGQPSLGQAAAGRQPPWRQLTPVRHGSAVHAAAPAACRGAAAC